MSLFWFAVVPFLLLATGFSLFWWLRRLRFFPNKTRDLVEVHVEFQEVVIEDFANLISAEADNIVNREWRLTRAQRRKVGARRLKLARGFLSGMAVNGALCMEVARFKIREIEKATGELILKRDHPAARLFDRGAMCHFMAAVCLVRMYFLEFRMIVSPFYVPNLGGRFEVRGHSLAAWYEHLVEEILEVADEHEKDWLYENTLFALTGLVEMPRF